MRGDYLCRIAAALKIALVVLFAFNSIGAFAAGGGVNPNYVLVFSQNPDDIESMNNAVKDKGSPDMGDGALNSSYVLSKDAMWTSTGGYRKFSFDSSDTEDPHDDQMFAYTTTYYCSVGGTAQDDRPTSGAYAEFQLSTLVHLQDGFYKPVTHKAALGLKHFTSYRDATPAAGTATSDNIINDWNVDQIAQGDNMGQIAGKYTACLPSGPLQAGQHSTFFNMRNRNDPAITNDPAADAQWTAAEAATQSQTDTNPGGTGTSDDESGYNKCDAGALGFGWLLCPIIAAVDKSVVVVFQSWVQSELHIDPISTSGSDANRNLYALWKNVRNLADAFFVLIFLFFIFANVLAYQLDAYAVKKIVPKLAAASILVQFSYVFCGIMIDIGNILGNGIQMLITRALPAGTIGSNPYSASGIFGKVAEAFGAFLVLAGIRSGLKKLRGSGGGLSALGDVTVFVVVIGAIIIFIAFMVLILTLVSRKMFIDALIILAPLAIAAMVLPSTEKYFKKWYSQLARLISMYPIIMFIFSVAVIFQASSGGGLSKLVAAAFPIIACFLVPQTYKWGGSLLTQTNGFIANLGNKAKNYGTGKVKGSSGYQAARSRLAEDRLKQKMDRLDPDGAGPAFLNNNRLGRAANSKFKLAQRLRNLEGAGSLSTANDVNAYTDRVHNVLSERDFKERQEMLKGLKKGVRDPHTGQYPPGTLKAMLEEARASGNHREAMAISRHMLDQGTLDGDVFGTLMGMQATAADRARVRDELRNSNYSKFKQNMLAYHVANEDDLATVTNTGDISLGNEALDKLHNASADQLLNVGLDGQEILKKTKVRGNQARNVDGHGTVMFSDGDSIVNGGAGGVGVYGQAVKNTMVNPQNAHRVSQGHRDTFDLP